ncbi:MAG: competence type IV pilus assembly protein ComGB [Sporolactobacillus sp.]
MRLRSRWTGAERAQLFLQIGRCLKDGHPLHAAVRLQSYRRVKQQQADLMQMIAALSEGEPFHRVLKKIGSSDEAIAYIYFSEMRGDLAQGLCDYGAIIARREANRQQLRQLLRYPLMLFWLFALLLYLIGHYLLPNFLLLYASLRIELPLSTRVILWIARHFMMICFVAVLLIAGAGACFMLLRQQPVMRRISAALHIPVISMYVRRILTQKTAFQLGSMLRTGLSMRQCIQLMNEYAATPFLRAEARRLDQALLNGQDIEQMIADVRYYLHDFSTVIQQGAATGMLGEAMYRYSEAVMTAHDAKTRQLIALCQPLMLISIGVLMLILFASVLLPVFETINGL